jgi:hypothetical protein
VVAPRYISVPVVVDVDAYTAKGLDYLATQLGFTPVEGDPGVWIVEATARIVAQAAAVWAKVPERIFETYGTSLLALPPKASAQATAPTTWTMSDAAGYTIPAGTTVAYRTAGDTLVPFTVVTSTTVPPGSTVATGVTIRALDPGLAANGLAVGTVELIDALGFVASIASTSVSAGGVDAETEEAYRDRLVEELRLSTPRPILPGDFAVLAKRIAGVYRAVAIDGYNPADSTTNNERMVFVSALDVNGNDVSAATRTAIDDYLQSEREINFVVNVGASTRTTITVTVTVKAVAGADTAAVKTAVEQALKDYLSAKRWAGGAESPPEWRDERVVRYLEVAQVVNAVAGVDHITTTGGLFDLLVNTARADVTLTGVASLPTSGTHVATVT